MWRLVTSESNRNECRISTPIKCASCESRLGWWKLISYFAAGKDYLYHLFVWFFCLSGYIWRNRLCLKRKWIFDRNKYCHSRATTKLYIFFLLWLLDQYECSLDEETTEFRFCFISLLISFRYVKVPIPMRMPRQKKKKTFGKSSKKNIEYRREPKFSICLSWRMTSWQQ